MNPKLLLPAIAVILLGACSTLPSSGPTGREIESSALDPQAAELGIKIIPVDSMADVPPTAAAIELELPEYEPPATDLVGAGDVLSITIFEAGVSLFSGDGGATVGGGAFDPSVRAQTLPPRRVDDNGMIEVPYVGRLRVLGNTVNEVQEQIRLGLQGLSQDPQVLVSLSEVIGNSVIMSGEIMQPGRLVLETNRETLGDVVALAGGYRGEAKDLALIVERGQNMARLRLSDVLSGSYSGIRAYPGDRLTVVTDPLMFSVLGASGRVQQFNFSRDSMSVVEAIASAGGPSANTGDPKAVFLFRYSGPDNTLPTVYHFNMLETPTFFLAQRFALQDEDILYFGNSASNQPRKVIQTIGQLFSPIVTATAVANNIDNGSN